MLHESPAAARGLHPKEKVIRALRKVSQSPLVFIFDEFVDKNLLESLQHRPTLGFGKEDMLQLLRDISPAATEPNPAQREFMELISCELFNGQWGANDALRVNCTKSTDPQNNSSASTASSYPEGLHVDTNNHAIFRSVTCILYLNDLAPECGGATIFRGDTGAHERGAGGRGDCTWIRSAESFMWPSRSSDGWVTWRCRASTSVTTSEGSRTHLLRTCVACGLLG